jgi:hypothetical protein
VCKKLNFRVSVLLNNKFLTKMSNKSLNSLKQKSFLVVVYCQVLKNFIFIRFYCFFWRIFFNFIVFSVSSLLLFLSTVDFLGLCFFRDCIVTNSFEFMSVFKQVNWSVFINSITGGAPGQAAVPPVPNLPPNTGVGVPAVPDPGVPSLILMDLTTGERQISFGPETFYDPPRLISLTSTPTPEALERWADMLANNPANNLPKPHWSGWRADLSFTGKILCCGLGAVLVVGSGLLVWIGVKGHLPVNPVLEGTGLAEPTTGTKPTVPIESGNSAKSTPNSGTADETLASEKKVKQPDKNPKKEETTWTEFIGVYTVALLFAVRVVIVLKPVK